MEESVAREKKNGALTQRWDEWSPGAGTGLRSKERRGRGPSVCFRLQPYLTRALVGAPTGQQGKSILSDHPQSLPSRECAETGTVAGGAGTGAGAGTGTGTGTLLVACEHHPHPPPTTICLPSTDHLLAVSVTP